MSLSFDQFLFRVPGRDEASAHGTVGDSERVVIRGPSGCGKTTLLRSLAGLTQSIGGSVQLGARDLTQLAPQDRHLGFVFQGGALFPHLSVAENVVFGLRYSPKGRDWSEDMRARHVHQWLAKVGLEGFAERAPAALSGGERQRVALIRGLIWEPAALLLDEPLSAVDPDRRGELQAWIKELLAERPVPTLIVTHDAEEARVLGTRVVEWNNGKVSF